MLADEIRQLVHTKRVSGVTRCGRVARGWVRGIAMATWAMTNDNAAILTTVNAAVLVIGAVRYTQLMRKLTSARVEQDRERQAALGLLIEGKRSGSEPSMAALLALKKQRHVIQEQLPVLLATTVWFAICVMLVRAQVDILEWAGTAEASGAAPQLARDCFYVTAGSLTALVFEGFISAFSAGLKEQRRDRRAFEQQYTKQERRELRRQARDAHLPPPPPPPSPDDAAS